MNRNSWWMLGGLIVAAVFAVQFKQINKLKKDLSTLRTELSSATESQASATEGARAPEHRFEESELVQKRLAHLEETVANFAKGPRVGPIAPLENVRTQATDEQLDQMRQRLLDPTTPENERLKALRSLRRSDKLSDDVLAQTLSMLSTANPNFRLQLLQSLDGVTNSALKQPLMAMLDEPNPSTGSREQVVNMLRRFADDPAVESKLWDLALNDPNTRVQDQARDALARVQATPERVEQLLNRAANPQASLDERLISFRALRLAKSQTPELVADLATLAQNTTDPIARAKLFKSFNGLTDPSLMVPLVNGLQDGDPIVRQNAANALSEFPDPRVQQWLTHLIQNDSDPAVKREAHAALERTQRLSH